MAYASDVGYNITIQTIPIETMGKYEVHTNEPVSYTVEGSFSVVRYSNVSAATALLTDQDEGGNAPGSNIGGSSLSLGTAPGAHLNPAKLLSSSTFDIEIMEKGTGSIETPVFKISDCRINARSASLNKRGVLVDSFRFVAILAGDMDVATPNVVAESGMDKEAK